jgi:hypothetical protein
MEKKILRKNKKKKKKTNPFSWKFHVFRYLITMTEMNLGLPGQG